ncbi:MAG TPA: hypothetical protein PK323_11265 [Bacteroidia bacterium]|nr:hypothetical protein [Bacteroidia bacterium]
MQEFILTLVVIFVLFKVFGRSNIIYYNQHHHAHHHNDGKIKVHHSKEKKNNKNDDGEYVDYEEIK